MSRLIFLSLTLALLSGCSGGSDGNTTPLQDGRPGVVDVPVTDLAVATPVETPRSLLDATVAPGPLPVAVPAPQPAPEALPDTTSPDIRQYGHVVLYDDTFHGELDAVARFTSINPAIPQAELDDIVGHAADTCIVEPLFTSAALTDVDKLADAGYASSAISAGDQVVINENDGSTGALYRSNDGTELFYTSVAPLTLPAPQRLTVSVAGGDFPAVALQLETPQPFADLAVALGSLTTLDRAFEWPSSQAGDAYVELTFTGQGERPVAVTCLALNDGSFTPSQATLLAVQSMTSEREFVLESIASASIGELLIGDSLLRVVRLRDQTWRF